MEGGRAWEQGYKKNAALYNLHMAKSDTYRHPKCVGVNPGMHIYWGIHMYYIATLMRSFFMTIYLMKMGGPYVRGSYEPPMAKTACIVNVPIHE